MAVKIYSESGDYFIEDMEDFSRKYKVIVASGGLVRNALGELLIIYRRGKWDLPKGKQDEGETLELCAEREIKEETGLKEVFIDKPLITTHHVYAEKNKDILKETHWFRMNAPGNQPLLPQTEEDIDKAEWVPPSRLSLYSSNTYSLIRDVLAAAGY